jgi:hypothetical protein
VLLVFVPERFPQRPSAGPSKIPSARPEVVIGVLEQAVE